MPTRPKFFLLDAGPVIELHRLGLWQDVIARADITLPGKVFDDEAAFWDGGDGVGHPIHLEDEAAAGRIKVARAESTDLTETARRFDPTVRERVDQGELEAIALLLKWAEPLPQLCTADRMAVVALCLVGLSHVPVSLEGLLETIGLGRQLQWKHSKAALMRWRAEGTARHIDGSGLTVPGPRTRKARR